MNPLINKPRGIRLRQPGSCCRGPIHPPTLRYRDGRPALRLESSRAGSPWPQVGRKRPPTPQVSWALHRMRSSSPGKATRPQAAVARSQSSVCEWPGPPRWPRPQANWAYTGEAPGSSPPSYRERLRASIESNRRISLLSHSSLENRLVVTRRRAT